MNLMYFNLHTDYLTLTNVSSVFIAGLDRNGAKPNHLRVSSGDCLESVRSIKACLEAQGCLSQKRSSRMFSFAVYLVPYVYIFHLLQKNG